MSEKPCGAYFFAFFENFFVPILTSGGLAAVSSSAFAALYSAFGKYDVVHIHAEGPAFFAWLPKMFGKRVVVTVHGIDWQREKWQSGLGSKFIHQGEKNAAKYADEVIVLSKGVQDYFKETYGRKTHFIPNGVNRPQIREDKNILGTGIVSVFYRDYEIYPTDLMTAIKLDGVMIQHSAKSHPKRGEYYMDLDKESLKMHVQRFIPIRKQDYLIERSKGILYRMGIYKILKKII